MSLVTGVLLQSAIEVPYSRLQGSHLSPRLRMAFIRRPPRGLVEMLLYYPAGCELRERQTVAWRKITFQSKNRSTIRLRPFRFPDPPVTLSQSLARLYCHFGISQLLGTPCSWLRGSLEKSLIVTRRPRGRAGIQGLRLSMVFQTASDTM
jgi:hypothetical protein